MHPDLRRYVGAGRRQGTKTWWERIRGRIPPAGERGVLGSRESLAYDRAGLADGDHGVVRQPEELVTNLP